MAVGIRNGCDGACRPLQTHRHTAQAGLIRILDTVAVEVVPRPVADLQRGRIAEHFKIAYPRSLAKMPLNTWTIAPPSAMIGSIAAQKITIGGAVILDAALEDSCWVIGRVYDLPFSRPGSKTTNQRLLVSCFSAVILIKFLSTNPLTVGIVITRRCRVFDAGDTSTHTIRFEGPATRRCTNEVGAMTMTGF